MLGPIKESSKLVSSAAHEYGAALAFTMTPNNIIHSETIPNFLSFNILGSLVLKHSKVGTTQNYLYRVAST
jgi:hypothetical protein